ncbi:hypothetical protein [Halopiger goleimassiliensis]|uniref:hypothetical protein n=1 Tax=Halopiger goleimassiliensis TaxID=1293048 RepID=UPI00067804C1|nr:hypothetical protein [Halopiger goleimassiliensis]
MGEGTPLRRTVLGLVAGTAVPIGGAVAGTEDSAADVTVRILETSDPVRAGDRLVVRAAITNRSDAAVTDDAALIVGDDPDRVDARSVTLGPGETTVVTLSFETAIVQRDQSFPVRVAVGDRSDARQVRVIANGPAVSVRIVGTNDPVDAGDVLEVVAAVETDASTTADLAFVVGEEPTVVDRRSVSLEAGEREYVEFAFETYPVEHDDEFPVRVETATDAVERTVRVFGTAGSGLERRRPPEEAITIEPGTAVLFEVDPAGAVDHTDVAWDGDGEPPPGTPLAVDYTSATGWPAAFRQFDAPGTYAVTATGPDGETVGWTVRVENGGASAPTVELAVDPGPDARVGVDDPVVFTATAAADAPLAQVVWVEGQNLTVPAVSPLEGTYDVATLSRSPPGWVSAGYPTSAFAVTAAGLVSEVATIEGPEIRPPVDVEIVATNDPVEGGARLEVVAEATNVGGMMMVGDPTQELRLIVGHDPELVDTATVAPAWNETERVTLGYETYPVATDDEFPVRVEGADDAAERTVLVRGTDGGGGEPAVDVSITATNAPVQAGRPLEVTAVVENAGSEPIDRELTLVVGHDPEVVDSRTVSLAPGERRSVTLGYETYPAARTTTFPVVVEAAGATARRSVTVIGTES